MDRASWKVMYNLFDHKRPLDVETNRALYAERPGAPARLVLEEHLDLEPNAKILLCGSIGCGKSSELARMATLASGPWHVVYVDAFASVTDVRRLDPAETLFLIGAAVIASIQRQSIDFPAAERDALFAAWRKNAASPPSVDPAAILTGVAVFSTAIGALGGALAAPQVAVVTAGAALVSPLVKLWSSRPALLGGTARGDVRETDPDVRQLVDATNGVIRAAKALVDRDLVILVDGLDKIDDLDRIRQLFTRTTLLASPEAAMIYTAPVVLMVDSEWVQSGAAFDRVRLTNIVVSAPPAIAVHDTLVQEGRAALRHVVQRRVERAGWLVPDVIADDALEALIDASGGVLRTLIYLVNHAIRDARHGDRSRIGAAEAEHAIGEAAQEFSIGLDQARLEELARVQATGMPSGSELSRRMLLGNLILPYRNGDIWFAPAPLAARKLR